MTETRRTFVGGPRDGDVTTFFPGPRLAVAPARKMTIWFVADDLPIMPAFPDVEYYDLVRLMDGRQIWLHEERWRKCRKLMSDHAKVKARSMKVFDLADELTEAGALRASQMAYEEGRDLRWEAEAMLAEMQALLIPDAWARACPADVRQASSEAAD